MLLTFTGNISFEGSTDDAFETTFAITDPTADRTITFKDESGTVAYLSDISGISTFLPLTGGTMTGQILGDTSLMSEREKLQLAYDTAIRLDPAISQQMFAQQQQNLQAQSQAQRAKAAAVQIKGAPSAGLTTALNQTDRRAVIANALRTANY